MAHVYLVKRYDNYGEGGVSMDKQMVRFVLKSILGENYSDKLIPYIEYYVGTIEGTNEIDAWIDNVLTSQNALLLNVIVDIFHDKDKRIAELEEALRWVIADHPPTCKCMLCIRITALLGGK